MIRILSILPFLVSLCFTQHVSGQTWEPINSPYDDLQQIVLGRADGEIYVYGSKLYASSDLGKNWKLVTHNDTPIAPSNVVVDSNGSLVVSVLMNYVGQKILRVTDKGNNVELIDTNRSLTKVFPGIVLSDGVILGGFENKSMARSTDAGTTWSPLSQEGFPAALDKVGRIYALHNMAPYLSEDGGASWRFIDPGNLGVIGLYVVEEKVFLKGLAGVITSTDQGMSWSSPQVFASTLPYFQVASTYLNQYVANSPNTVFRSIDKGESWEPISTGLPQGSSFSSLISKGQEVFVLASGSSGGRVIYKLSLPAAHVQPEWADVARLSVQVSPEEVVIRSSGLCSAELFNQLGQKICDGTLTSQNPWHISRSSIARGLYFVKSGSVNMKFLN